MERPDDSASWDADKEEEFSFDADARLAWGRSREAVAGDLRNAIDDDGGAARALENAERYRTTIALRPLAAWTADAIGGILDVDKRGPELTGLSLKEAPGRVLFKALHPEDRPNIAMMWRKDATLGHPIDNDVRTRLHDGSYRGHRSRRAASRPLRQDPALVWHDRGYPRAQARRRRDPLGGRT